MKLIIFYIGSYAIIFIRWLRNSLVGLLYTSEEKYLIAQAIETKIEKLTIYKISEKTADVNNIEQDVRLYYKLKSAFFTKDIVG